jgi:hypothetical protein
MPAAATEAPSRVYSTNAPYQAFTPLLPNLIIRHNNVHPAPPLSPKIRSGSSRCFVVLRCVHTAQYFMSFNGVYCKNSMQFRNYCRNDPAMPCELCTDLIRFGAFYAGKRKGKYRDWMRLAGRGGKEHSLTTERLGK